MITIQNYKVLQMIHEGKRFIIYKAYHEFSKKNVMIKLLKNEYPSPYQTARFHHEYEMMQKLYDRLHHLVLRPFELIKFNNTYGIVLEDIDAISLDQMIKMQGRLSIPQFLQIALPLTEILGYVHAQNVLHKDINPSNIIWNAKKNLVKIIDFGLSTTLPYESLDVSSANAIEGTLSYISPEQTGRMNRVVDYRSDYYSLGVSFYEMITGQLPFLSQSPMELVYAHIAKIPQAPQEINPDIPQPISELIMKLLSKTPENRYQGTLGILYDLQECQNQYRHKKNIFFTIGKHDIPSRFQISEKLYGREIEIKRLMDAFERVCVGKPELMLISGYSGVGKSSLVHEVHKPIAERMGYFISGKCDQFKRNIPYESLVEALQKLIQQILTESQEQINQWKNVLQDALGVNGRVVINVIPQIKYIIGPQPELDEMSASESQKRFEFVFQNFIQALCNPKRPLTIFLDDLQWADSSTLELLSRLLIDVKTHHLFVIGAYRSNEVNQSHMLMLMLNDLVKTQVMINNIQLVPLQFDHVAQLIADSLHSSTDKVNSLADICYLKTHGNPFFLNRLLLSLYEEKLIYFDLGHGLWVWNLEKIKTKEISENVLEFMSEKILQLKNETQQVLHLAACLGNKFELTTLAKIHQRSLLETSAQLWSAMQEGLIIPENENYNYIDNQMDVSVPYHFLHDRVQQTIYSLISEETKVALHYKIGKILLQGTLEADLEDNLFEIVNHLNLGSTLVSSEDEKILLVKLNLRAGKKAKASSAFTAAVNYLRMGYYFLSKNSWTDEYALTYELLKEYTACLYISKEHEEAEHKIKELLEHARTPLEKGEIAILQIDLYTASGNKEDAMAAAIQGLEGLGMKISRNPSKIALSWEFLLSKWNLGQRKIADLIFMPPLANPNVEMMLKICQECQNSAVFSASALYGMLVLKQINLLLRYGNSVVSGEGYISYAVLLNAVGDLKSAFEYAKIALKISERETSDANSKGRIIAVYAALIHGWNYHWRTLKPYFKQAIDLGLQSAVPTTVAIGSMYILLMDPTLTLDTIVRESPKYLALMKQFQHQDLWDSAKLHFQFVANLCGKTNDIFSFSDQDFDEQECLDRMLKSNFVMGHTVYNIFKALNFYYYGEYRTALMYINNAHQNIEPLLGTLTYAELRIHTFYTYAALYPQLPMIEQWKVWVKLKKIYQQVIKWADYCPVNFLHHRLLIEAEWARLSNKIEKASELYDLAIEAARDNEYIRYEALANELAGQFYFNLNKMKFAKLYLQDSHYCYLKWGAFAKAKHLEKKFPAFFTSISSSSVERDYSSTSSNELTTSEALDFISIMKASQAITREIHLKNLIEKMMRVVVENAGAEKGYLILENGGVFFIQAVADSENVLLLPSLPVSNLPMSIINLVAASKESLLIDDASRESDFSEDPQVIKNQSKSVLCVPLLNLGTLKGLLYLENNLAKGVFTKERLDAINMLSTQMAISIDNANFYRALEEKVQKRTQELRESQNLLVQKEKMAFLGMLTRGIGHEIKNPLNFIINFSRFIQENLLRLDSLIKKIQEQTEIVSEIHESLNTLKDHSQVIYEQGKKADTIVTRMIEHSESGNLQFAFIDIHQFLDQVINASYAQMRKQNPDFIIRIEKDFDSTLRYIKVADINLNHVLMNILNNAYYATIQKKKALGDDYHPLLIVKLIHRGRKYEIRIKDNGIGISPQNVDKIFTPFFTTKPTGQGVGLGLSLCYNIIVNEYGGTLTFNSQFNEYAEFIISLPYLEEENKGPTLQL